MKKVMILPLFVTAFYLFGIGESDFEFQVGASLKEDIVKGPIRHSMSEKGVVRLKDKKNYYYRFEQNANDPKHRARLNFSLPRNNETFNKASYTISAIARMDQKRNGNLYVAAIQNVRLGIVNAIPYVFINSQKKPFSIHADLKKTPFIPGEWMHLHLSINRNGQAALYVNGEQTASYDIADRKDEEWAKDPYFFIVAYNKKADQDNPIAKMDIMRIKVKEGLMSSAQIRKEAMEWLAELKNK